MPAAVFTHTSGTLTFGRNPQRPERALAPQQAESESAGGARYGYTPAATEKLITLHWPAMSSANWAALKIFFATTAGGMSSTWTYTDPAGTARTVRFADPELAASEVTADSVAVSVRLLEA